MEGKLYTEAEVMEYANRAIDGYMKNYHQGELIGVALAIVGFVTVILTEEYIKQKRSCKES